MNDPNRREQENLLNIKQAASFLGASEISLRRWSDAGKLHCVRIGGRRERRFYLSDLRAFLQQDSIWTDTARMDHHKHGSHILLEGMAIDHGQHLCSFYETDAGRLKLAIPFLLGGLQTEDRCYLVAAHGVQTHILDTLRELSLDVDRAISQNQLICMDGLASGKAMLAYFEQAFLTAGKNGIQGMRVLGDMAWVLSKNISIAQLQTFEMQYNAGLGKRFPVVSLCQYDARLFSGSGVLGALKCHDDLFDYPLAHFLGI